MERAVSAGGVVYREADGRIQVLLCHRREPPLWCIPKGTPDPGESLEETARREVREETGVDAAIVRSIGQIRYWFTRASEGKRYDKTVHHFLMTATGGDPAFHDQEFDAVEWVDADEARRRLTYLNEAEVLARALTMINELRGEAT